jgi:prefoldin subunit 5
MTPTEIERLARKTLGRPADDGEQTVCQLQREIIRVFERQVTLLEQQVNLLEQQVTAMDRTIENLETIATVREQTIREMQEILKGNA